MTANNNNGPFLNDEELQEFLIEAGLPSDAYQARQRQKHDQAIATGNATAARDAVWRAASDRNLIDETETPELNESQASAIKTKLGWQ